MAEVTKYINQYFLQIWASVNYCFEQHPMQNYLYTTIAEENMTLRKGMAIVQGLEGSLEDKVLHLKSVLMEQFIITYF